MIGEGKILEVVWTGFDQVERVARIAVFRDGARLIHLRDNELFEIPEGAVVREVGRITWEK